MTDAEQDAQRIQWARDDDAATKLKDLDDWIAKMDMDHAADAAPYWTHVRTQTIPQMVDRHERQIFTHKAERVVNQVLAFALTVLAVVFVGGLMYKAFVWGY